MKAMHKRPLVAAVCVWMLLLTGCGGNTAEEASIPVTEETVAEMAAPAWYGELSVEYHVIHFLISFRLVYRISCASRSRSSFLP